MSNSTVVSGSCGSVGITGAGVYFVSYALSGSVSSAATVMSFTIIGNGSVNYNNGYYTFQTGYFTTTGTDILTCTANSTISINIYVVGGSATFTSSQSYLKAVRIA